MAVVQGTLGRKAILGDELGTYLLRSGEQLGCWGGRYLFFGGGEHQRQHSTCGLVLRFHCIAFA